MDEDGSAGCPSWHASRFLWLSRGQLGLGEPLIRLHYTLNRSNEYFEYPIKLTTTRPYFGGVRLWFMCPMLNLNGRLIVS